MSDLLVLPLEEEGGERENKERVNMSKWEYHVTLHEVPARCGEENVVECDQSGRCLVHDVCQGGVEWLEDLFRAKGREGWELVQSGYHNRELLCIWKKRTEIRRED